MGQENITLFLLAVIGLVFLIDFIKNNSKKSIDKSVEEFVKKEEKKSSSLNPIDWILNRKKNITLSIIIICFAKFILHFSLYPSSCFYEWSDSAGERVRVHWEEVYERNRIYSTRLSHSETDFDHQREKHRVTDDINYHIEVLFVKKIELFIPVTILFLILVWFFNDKIKAK